ncbi:hepatic and glial cell adhesion molecule-like isoform X2 [Hypanus sabinus]|uniref:hepatic and glial cell adhesion molecule-like isoform X2 n=1 Tax=Hypanus sabinus TaxID=79690 RepID=UPI0028C4C328|nr:hepatic and glial cell adhesion molecule-like isoform X2 [Hypanus sabinus]
MLCRLYPVILAALLISTGGRAATEPASGTQELLGIAGSSLDFGSVYDQVVRQELYSVTLKKSQPTLRVFLSIISSGKMIPSNSYKDRVKFDPDSGSLQLLNFTAGDTGTYQLILTASNGTDFTKSIRVRLYELSRPEIRAYQSENNISLSCVVENGTNPQQNWSKDGVSVEGGVWTLLSHDRQNLTLLAHLPAVCGTYTCLVWNRLGMASANYSLRESDGFPFCREEPVLKRKRFHIILIVVSLLVLLHIGIFVWVKKRRNRRMI